MWAIRILNGSQAGQIYPLKEGKNRIGRAPGVDFQINSSGVSKEHIEITVLGDRVLFTDLNSSNGTFLNGVKVKAGSLKLGDKIGLHEVLFDLIVSTERLQSMAARKNQLPTAAIPRGPQPLVNPYPPPQSLYQMPQPHQQPQFQSAAPARQPPRSLLERSSDYFNKKLIPSLYQITEHFEFRFVLLGFIAAYMLLITVLSVIPMNQLTSDTISIESRRRAITVARAVARGNERSLRSGDMASFSADIGLKEDGVDDVYVVGKDGRLLAPSDRVGAVPKEIGFFKKEILKAGTRELSGELGSKVIAAIPIISYDTDTQQNIAKAYAVVVYNPSSLAFDNGRTLSLFIQIFAVAILIGGVLFLFMYKLIEFPFDQLNKELDIALRDGQPHAQVKMKFPSLQKLMTNINSLLTRASQATTNQFSQEAGQGSKNHEYINILQLIGYPGLLINKDGLILKANFAFEALVGVAVAQIENQKISSLPDQALQKNITELMTGAKNQPVQLAMDKLEIGGHMFNLSCQVVTLTSGDVDCYFFTISPNEQSDGQSDGAVA